MAAKGFDERKIESQIIQITRRRGYRVIQQVCELERQLLKRFGFSSIQPDIDSCLERMVSFHETKSVQKVIDQACPLLVELSGTDIRDRRVYKQETEDRQH